MTWPSLSGTSVSRDFVELPSQLFEHWLDVPQVLDAHARHVKTGAPMPAELRDRIIAAERADAGFATTEYLESALVDLAFHTGEPPADPMAPPPPAPFDRRRSRPGASSTGAGRGAPRDHRETGPAS